MFFGHPWLLLCHVKGKIIPSDGNWICIIIIIRPGYLSAEGEDLTTSITCLDFPSVISGLRPYYDKIHPLKDTLMGQRGYNIQK
jgi:hypothetical protein